MKQFIIKSTGAYINFLAMVAPNKCADLGFSLMCKVNKAGVSEKGEQFFKEGEQHFFKVEGHSAVLHKWGSGPKSILFLHGWESNSQRWLPYYNLLDKSGYTMYALDAPGHGMANGSVLNIELYKQAIEHAVSKIGAVDTVVAHSLGNTALGYFYLNNAPIPVNKFVLMGAATGMDAIFAYIKNMVGLSDKVLSLLSTKVNTILKIPHQEITLSNFVSKVKEPILIVHDEDDKITPYFPILKIIKKNKKVDSFITTGLKHDLKSEEVYKKVIAFINK